MAKYENPLRSVALVGLALSDDNRLRLLRVLAEHSLCVCQMTELLGLAPSTVSKHLSVLKDAGLVHELKEGRWVFHRLCPLDCICRPVVDWALTQLAADPLVRQDRKRMKEILSIPAEELCRK